MTKKNVLCIGWCDADDVINYGQVLQACAMMIIIRKHTYGTIKYVSYLPRSLYSKLFYWKGHLTIKNGHLLAWRQTRKLIKKVIKENGISFFQVRKKKTVQNIAKDTDIFICGSDQIWHPLNYDNYYFLDFAPTDAPMYSFAASLPKKTMEERFINEYKKMTKSLVRFTRISVREVGSVEITHKLAQKEVEHVIDPTLLIGVDKWLELEEKMTVPNRYIFVYVPNNIDSIAIERIHAIQELLGIKEVLFLMTRGTTVENSSWKKIGFVSVGQFLYLINHASAVFTTSFHAVVFSVLFQKDFWCYDVPNINRGEDIRLSDFLDMLSLKNRLLDEKNNTITDEIIDYAKVITFLNAERDISCSYLSSIFE